MSMRIAYSAANSALMTIQSQMSVSSNNIANADTDGYTRKVANLTATNSGSYGTGVTVSSVTSTASSSMVKSVVKASSTLGSAEVVASYMSSLGDAMGTIDSDGTTGSSLSSMIDDLESSLRSLADTPESDTLVAQVLGAVDDAASQLRTTSASVQQLRSQADSDIDAAVDTVNSALNTIDSLNEQIVSGQARGLDTSNLEDQRYTALQSISENMEVSYFTDSNGAMKVYTDNGIPLVDSQVHELSFNSAGTLNSGVSYPTNLSGITVGSIDITSNINSGAIGGLLQLRDEDLPAVQDELDQLATSLMTALNSVSNTGTSLPAPNSLTGTATVAGTDAVDGSGTVRVAVLNSDGEVDEYQDFDLSSYSTIDDLIADIDGMGGISASLDSDGHLVISADDTDMGVSIGAMDGTMGTDSENMSMFFGLNDLLTGTGASDISLSSRIAEDSSAFAVGALSDSSTLTVGEIGVAAGDGSVATALADALSGETTFDAAGNMSAMTTSLSSYASGILSDVSTSVDSSESKLASAETRYTTQSEALSSQSGVNLDEENALISQLENAYATAASLIEALNSMFDDLLTAVKST
ncbi:flagellar hook-associated protein FlgK [Insolitispirillum peregrinum]|uniref:Flagellar hook-associated protein 1 n=1 Tax=Insolitispirillum peregrinum TaxID=80876 RepID=A0A1N7KG16_9PROT|nr:flagellar hook-associated protein FlgK [Insolitispirillum peregrinum]SIS60507.1 flagellar hook-associated protein 1 FlgK [Insolitispirillum peregrinum]